MLIITQEGTVINTDFIRRYSIRRSSQSTYTLYAEYGWEPAQPPGNRRSDEDAIFSGEKIDCLHCLVDILNKIDPSEYPNDSESVARLAERLAPPGD